MAPGESPRRGEAPANGIAHRQETLFIAVVEGFGLVTVPMLRGGDAAFPGGELCVDAYRAIRACRPYTPRLDVVVLSSSSEVAAFATLWLDTHNGVVQIERAGCHPDHRRLGLTRAVILQALHWSVELGATSALVRHVSTNTAAQSLYESCGFTTICEDTGFFKTILRSDFEWPISSVPQP